MNPIFPRSGQSQNAENQNILGPDEKDYQRGFIGMVVKHYFFPNHKSSFLFILGLKGLLSTGL